MADNTTLNAGTGGDVISTDDIAGVKVQRVKVQHGADGSATDVSTASPLPVTLANTGANATPVVVDLGSNNDVTVTGTVDLGATDNAVLDAIAASVAGTLTVGSHAVTNAGTFAVQVTSLPASTNTVEVVGDAAENAAAAGNPVLTGGRYDSSPRTLGNGDVGAVALNASGQVLVEIAAGAGSGGTAAADDADFTAGTTSGTPVMGSYQSSPTAVTDGDMGIIGITANREVKVAVTSGGITGVVEDAAAAGGEEGIMILGVRRDAAASSSGTDGDFSTLNLTSAGRLWTSAVVDTALPAGTNNIGDVDILSIAAGDNNIGNVDVVTVPTDPFGANADAASATGSISAKLRFIAATGIPVTSLPTLGTVTTVGTVTNITNQGQIADDAAFTPATTRVMMAGFFADETATDSVDEGDGGAARMTLDRKVIVTPYAHAAAGGITAFRSIDVDETEDEVKASAGKLFWIHAINLTASVLYLKVYNNTAAGTVVGTTTPVFTFPVPTLGDTNGAGFVANFGDYGIAMSTGICVAATTALADADTGAPAANALVVNAGYL